jgi:Zn-finger protein
MKNSYKFFENRSCKFYPCHKNLKQINCLFCFCPLFTYPCPNRPCEKCIFPHKPENYEKLIKLLKRLRR